MFDSKLVEKIMLALVPEDTKIAVQNSFDNFHRDPIYVSCGGMNDIQVHFSKQPEHNLKFATINGLLLGMFLTRMSALDEGRDVFNSFLEAKKRVDGENVVDFQQMLINKRR